MEGDGTMRGFRRALKRAADQGPFDVVHVHGPQMSALLLLNGAVSGLRLRNAVSTVHNSFRSYRFRNRLLLAPIFAAYPAVAVCGSAALESMPPLLRRLGKGRTWLVPNGVDLEGVDRTLRDVDPPDTADAFTVLSVGSLIERKDPITLLRAFARNPDAEDRLVYVGEGSLRNDLVEEARRLGVESRLTLTGLVERNEVYGRLAVASVCVSVSRGEGLPVAVLEMMACRRPVILSDIPPHREIAADADFIPLIAPGDAEALARELERFRAMGPAARAEIGERCRKLVEDRFSLPVMHRGYDRVYAFLRSGRQRPRTEAELPE